MIGCYRNIHYYYIKMYVLYTCTIQQHCFLRCILGTHVRYSNNVSQAVCSVHMYHTTTIKRKQTRKQTIFLSMLLLSQKYFRIQYSVKKICGFPSAYQPSVGPASLDM